MYHRLTLGLLVCVTVVVAHSTWNVYRKKQESEQMRGISQKQVDELQSRDLELQAQIERLSTTPGVEEEIRSKFSVAKNGENMVVVVPTTYSASTTTMPGPTFWQKVWHFFGL